jgi:hypothetical protein
MTLDLFAVKLGARKTNCSEEELERFLIRWDTVVTGMRKQPDDDTMHTLFFNQVKEIEILDYDLKIYERLHDSEKNVETLRRYCERLIELKRSQENQRKRHGEHRQKSPNVSAAAPHRRRFSGSPRRSNSHSPGRYRKRSFSRSPGGTRKRSFSRSPGGTRFKRKGSKSRSTSRNRMCADFIKGKCTRGAGCKYSHTERDKKRSSSPRRTYHAAPSPGREGRKDKRGRTPSPGGKGGGKGRRSVTPNRKPTAYTKSEPCFLFMKGKCHYGSKCCYSHDDKDKPRDSASAPNTPDKRQSNNSPAPGGD